MINPGWPYTPNIRIYGSVVYVHFYTHMYIPIMYMYIHICVYTCIYNVSYIYIYVSMIYVYVAMQDSSRTREPKAASPEAPETSPAAACHKQWLSLGLLQGVSGSARTTVGRIFFGEKWLVWSLVYIVLAKARMARLWEGRSSWFLSIPPPRTVNPKGCSAATAWLEEPWGFK